MKVSSADCSDQVPDPQGRQPVVLRSGHTREERPNRTEWTMAEDSHPLGSLDGAKIGSYKAVVALGTTNRFGARYFRIFVRNTSGELSQQCVLTGLHSQGKYPGYNWIEIISISREIGFATEVMTIAPASLIQQMFNYLADILPPGGHMMVEYDSAEQQDTARSLALGIPPPATPLGAVLFSAGCGFGFKDWYFAEGGSEGPRKLQGYKALDSQHARLKMGEIAQQLRAFLSQRPKSADSDLELAARNRASDILNSIEGRAHE